MQEVRRFKPSTIARRFSVTAGFYRTCAIDGVLEHSPAEHVRRPSVPPESPTLGFTHLQFEALLTTARESPFLPDVALVVMLGLLGLRIFEATGADIADLGEEHGHRVLRVVGGIRSNAAACGFHDVEVVIRKDLTDQGRAGPCARDSLASVFSGGQRAAPPSHGQKDDAARRDLVGRVRRAAACGAVVGIRAVRVPGDAGRRSG
jgi:hypothetical protein